MFLTRYVSQFTHNGEHEETLIGNNVSKTMFSTLSKA